MMRLVAGSRTNNHKGRAILSYPIDHGEISNIVVMDFEHKTWEHEKSIVPAKREELECLFVGWGTLTKGIIEAYALFRP